MRPGFAIGLTLTVALLGGAQTASTAPLPACAVEDGSSGPIPCRWQADVAGNGIGESFTITAPDVYVYDDGHTETVNEDGSVSITRSGS